MEGFSQERRGLFDGLKVPHNGNAVLIGAFGLLVYWAGVRLIEETLKVHGEGSCRLLAGMLGNLCSFFGYPGQIAGRLGGWGAAWTDYPGFVWIAFLAWNVAVWAFLAGAITRIAAMKLAREEGLELKDALRFGAKKWLSNVGSVVFVLIIIGFFYLVTNASLAGWIGRIPWVGGVVLGVLFVLVLVAAFLIVLAGALGVLGFNLAAAAISTEVSDAFDGVSRAWDYVLARPWNLITYYVSTLVYLGIVVFLGLTFIDVSVKSLAVGWWGLGEAPRAIQVDEAMRREHGLPPHLEVVYVPGRADYIYEQTIGRRYRPDESGNIFYGQGVEYALERFHTDTKQYPRALEDLIYDPATRGRPAVEGWKGPYLLMDEPPKDGWGRAYEIAVPGKGQRRYELFSRGKDPAANATADDVTGQEGKGHGFVGGVGRGGELNIAPFVEPSLKFAARGVSIWINIARLLLYGYCVAYFLSAQTMAYFLLRKEVEGEDYTEIMLEEEADEADDQPFEYGAGASATGPVDKPAMPPGATPPATPPTT